MLKILDTKKNTAQKNMEIDQDLLNDLDPNGDSILHFYDWTMPSVTYGYFIDISKYIDFEKAKKYNLDLSKRPTGGGIVFHIWDLAFSFLMPSNHKYFSQEPLKNYKFVNSIVQDATKEFIENKSILESDVKDKNNFNFCMAKASKYDVIYQNKKIAGAAQRKKKNGYLHQATISLINPNKDLLKDILKDKMILEAILDNSYVLFQKSDEIDSKRDLVKTNLIKYFSKIIS